MSGVASTGDRFRLPWRHSYHDGAKNLILVTIPTGYPPEFRHIDVRVRDRSGFAAEWRINRLPRTRRVLKQPVAHASPVTAKYGIQIGLEMDSGPRRSQTMARVRAVVPEAAPNQWELLTGSETGEWNSWSFQDRQEPHEDEGSVKLLKGRPSHGRTHVLGTPYQKHNRFVRMTSFLRRFETVEERVTFRDVGVEEHSGGLFVVVREPQTVTTPSGARVTLPAQEPPAYMRGATGRVYPDTAVTVQVDVAGGWRPQWLPHSPLCQTFRRPVDLSLDFLPPMRRSGWDVSPEQRRWMFNMKDAKPGHLKEFTVILRQRVNLETFPVAVVADLRDPHTPMPRGTTAAAED